MKGDHPDQPSKPPVGGNMGGNNGGGPPSNVAAAAPSPDEPSGPRKTAPQDLYRQNRLANDLHAPIGDLRPGSDFKVDAATGLCRLDVKNKGISTFTYARAMQLKGVDLSDGSWYKLPEGTTLPEGLGFFETGAGHWEIGPTIPVTITGFAQLLASIEGWVPIACE